MYNEDRSKYDGKRDIRMAGLQRAVAELNAERSRIQGELRRIDDAISALGAISGRRGGRRSASASTNGRRGRRRMSAAGRARIAAAQRARWAKVRKANAAK
jgi:hypothetical protein